MQDCCVSLQWLDEAQRYYAEAMASASGVNPVQHAPPARRPADTLLLLGRDEAADSREVLFGESHG
jgi:hypothetical protein